MSDIPTYAGPVIIVLAVIAFTIWIIARGKKD